MKFKSLALAAISALVLSACGGGTSAPAIDKDLHIKGTVAGSVLKATDYPVGYIYTNDEKSVLDFWAYMGQGEARKAYWVLDRVPNAKGNYSCAADGVRIWFDDYRGESNLYYVARDNAAGSTCSVTVDAVSSTEVSGTFTATMIYDGEGDAPAITVTNGTFRMPTNTEAI